MGVVGQYSKLIAEQQALERALLVVGSVAGRSSRPTIPAPRIHRLRDRLTAEQQEVVVAAYEAGVPVQALADSHEISTSSVRTLAETAGMPRRRTNMNEAEIAEAIELYESGLSLAKVGARFGRDTTTIHKLFTRRGVRRRDSHGRER